MAGHFASLLGVLMVALAWRGSLGEGTPQPEQIHISSTGRFSEFCVGLISLYHGLFFSRE